MCAPVAMLIIALFVRGTMNDTQLFAFEDDFVATLRCVPMAVRFKLDACGVKLSLRQWSRFTPGERHQLLMAPCGSPAQEDAYRAVLHDLIGGCRLIFRRRARMLSASAYAFLRRRSSSPQAVAIDRICPALAFDEC